MILHWRNKFYPNWTIIERVMTLCKFSKMAAAIIAAVPSQIYFRFQVLWRLAFTKAKSYLQFACNLRPDISIYGRDNYYFRFLKTNGRHIEILLPFSIFTFSLPSACGFPSVYQISSESDHPQQRYDVRVLYKMAAVSQVGFGLG